MDVLHEEGIASPSVDIEKVSQAAPGWFKHEWGELTRGKEMASFVDTATFNGTEYYLAAGYVNEWANKYEAPGTDGACNTSTCLRNPSA